MSKSNKVLDQLLQLESELSLFHTSSGDPMVTVTNSYHQENYLLEDSQFKRWLVKESYKRYKIVPNKNIIEEVVQYFSAKACFDGPEAKTFLRVANYKGDIFIDLGTSDWKAVRIGKQGWQIVNEPPVKFHRAAGMLPLPEPEKGGTIEPLRKLLNYTSEDDFTLLVGFIVGAFRPNGPYPILMPFGEQGSAKTTTTRILRSLVDPNISPACGAPKNEDELIIAAKTSWLLTFDNLSHITPDLSDAFCRISTGGGQLKRKLYTNFQAVLFEAQRPLIINGIEELAIRSDLADRAVSVNLPSLPSSKRCTERAIWNEVDKTKAKLFGAICDAISCALRHEESLVLKNPPRLADHAVWVSAAEQALGWTRGKYLKALQKNKNQATQVILDSTPVTPFIFQKADFAFSGTATKLHNDLHEYLKGEDFHIRRGIPSTPHGLSSLLRRLAPNLRVAGVEVIFNRSGGSNSQRLITLSRCTPITCDSSDADIELKDNNEVNEIALLKAEVDHV